MNYQIVLQFLGDSEQDFNKLIDFEDELEEKLEDIADVDGHDFGSGEMNIFILSNEPTHTFSLIKDLLEKNELFSNLKAAYRDVSEERYTILWPKNLIEFTIK